MWAKNAPRQGFNLTNDDLLDDVLECGVEDDLIEALGTLPTAQEIARAFSGAQLSSRYGSRTPATRTSSPRAGVAVVGPGQSPTAAAQAAAPRGPVGVTARPPSTTAFASHPAVAEALARSAVRQLTGGQVDPHLATVARGVVADIRAHLEPKLKVAIAHLDRAAAQRQATFEHRALNSRAAFEGDVQKRLRRIEKDMGRRRSIAEKMARYLFG